MPKVSGVGSWRTRKLGAGHESDHPSHGRADFCAVANRSIRVNFIDRAPTFGSPRLTALGSFSLRRLLNDGYRTWPSRIHSLCAGLGARGSGL
jgi:hypothetical protein